MRLKIYLPLQSNFPTPKIIFWVSLWLDWFIIVSCRHALLQLFNIQLPSKPIYSMYVSKDKSLIFQRQIKLFLYLRHENSPLLDCDNYTHRRIQKVIAGAFRINYNTISIFLCNAQLRSRYFLITIKWVYCY